MNNIWNDTRIKTLIWLGFWRDSIPNEAVTELQDILEVSKEQASLEDEVENNPS